MRPLRRSSNPVTVDQSKDANAPARPAPRWLIGSDPAGVLDYDVVVVGGGNAALCAALEARNGARRVLLLEKAPREFRGGNTQHTRDIRYAHDDDPYTTGVYADDEFLDDVLKVTGGGGDPALTRLTIRESRSIPTWMERQGIHWQGPLKGTLHLGRTNVFYLGGGKALVNTYYRTAEQRGIDIRYDAAVDDICMTDGRCSGVLATIGGTPTTVRARAVVVASGGFEANIPWLAEYWGRAAENYIIRGVSYNDGAVLAALYRHDVMPIGDPKGFHAVAVDARSPKDNGGIVTRLDTIPFGIVVNRNGERFYDEGEDLWPKRYAIWGRLIAEQSGQIAYSIFDSKSSDLFMPPLYKPIVASSIDELAGAIDVDRERLAATIDGYNGHIRPGGQFDPSVLDGCCTADLQPPKSHWAVPIDTPPYYVYPVRPGITFTYRGVAVDERARVLSAGGHPLDNVFAAGEIMAGNILAKGYLAGFGLTIGTVFGRIAGREAAAYATR